VKQKVNPNRMMLLRLRRRLELARRGHKLLKNKQERLMQNFFALVRETGELRRDIEKALLDINRRFIEGRAATDRQQLEDALELSTRRGELRIDTKVEMNVRTPVFELEIPDTEFAYSLTATSPELDIAFERLIDRFGDLLNLAERENALFLLSEELAKTRRRVNALEYVLIPDLETVIRSIEDKLSENERSNQTRLMKIKDMVEQRERES
jgi:V/A-type H+-transporting ATPase subunit D